MLNFDPAVVTGHGYAEEVRKEDVVARWEALTRCAGAVWRIADPVEVRMLPKRFGFSVWGPESVENISGQITLFASNFERGVDILSRFCEWVLRNRLPPLERGFGTCPRDLTREETAWLEKNTVAAGEGVDL